MAIQLFRGRDGQCEGGRDVIARSANFTPWRAFTAQLENTLETRKIDAVHDGRRLGHPGRDLFPRPRGGETRQSVDPDLWIGGRRGNRSVCRRSTGEPVWVQGRSGRAECDLDNPSRAGRDRLPFWTADFRTGSSTGPEAAGRLDRIPDATSLSRRRPDRGAAAKAGDQRPGAHLRSPRVSRWAPFQVSLSWFWCWSPGCSWQLNPTARARGCWPWRRSLLAPVCARS